MSPTMTSSPRASSPNPVGLWFCQISSGLQGRAEAQGAKDGGVTEKATEEVAKAKAPGGKDDAPRSSAVCRREAMAEATVCLLLDRFAPS